MDQKSRYSCHQLPLYPTLGSLQNASIKLEQPDLTRKQKGGSASPNPAKNLPEMAARPPLEGRKTAFCAR